ncbi:MAG TPA: FAD-dependent oxidoreductase [Roseiflexaceae bacterium]|nr:FAD-dependent oxidoreductase [Roseiflexaceae bacterium]HMP41445.1 FAD-dependent oxidoreductase [Roseiflexaceae bacterium]
MEHRLGNADRPVRIAIVGAGPAAFYAAEALLKQPDLICTIDFFNRLPTPFGLVRDGVAPDHQSIKAVTRIYEKIAEHQRVHYYGNVTIGRDLTHADLKQYYDQIIYAVGAQSDRQMGIPGEDLAGSYPATAFVGWYNGHCDYSQLTFKLDHPRVVVIGNGNVAMDVTRILVRDLAELAKTDIADHALAALRHSQVREVVVLGRRGPAQAAFTNAEIKEFGELAGVDVIVDPAEMQLDEASEESLAGHRVATNNVQILRSFAERAPVGAPRRIVLRFLASPVELIGSAGRVTSVRIERNELVPDDRGGLRAQGTGEFELLEAGLVLRSVGYRSIPLAGVPFDEQRAIIPNVAGRVTQGPGGAVIPGEYVVGWAKRGPSGVIGTNKPDSIATVASMVADLSTLRGIADERRSPTAIEQLLKARRSVYFTYQDWKKLDAYELARGIEQGRPRVKVTNVADMLKIAGKAHEV